jgi:hypothetical protein
MRWIAGQINMLRALNFMAELKNYLTQADEVQQELLLNNIKILPAAVTAV